MGLSVAFWSLIVCLLWLILPTSAAWADAQTDRFQTNARDQLQKPHRKAPYPCSVPGVGGRDRYVVEVTPWAAAAGLRRGDRVVAYGGTPLTGLDDSDAETWAQIPRGEYVDIRVERAGKEIPLRLPCRDDRPGWEAYVALGQAIAEGRWQDCVDAVSRGVNVTGMASSGAHNTAILCMLEKAKSDRQRPPEEYWRRLHAWATKAIEESRYRPTGLADVRGRLLNATETLEKAGRNTLAEDIKQQIATFNQSPPATEAARAESKTVDQVGTAFVVRPDGFLLTAFHVVKGAKEIEVFCPERGKVKAWVEKFSEANDLAVLRVADGLSVLPIREQSALGTKCSRSAFPLLPYWVAKPSLLMASSVPCPLEVMPAICRSPFQFSLELWRTPIEPLGRSRGCGYRNRLRDVLLERDGGFTPERELGREGSIRRSAVRSSRALLTRRGPQHSYQPCPESHLLRQGFSGGGPVGPSARADN